MAILKRGCYDVRRYAHFNRLKLESELVLNLLLLQKSMSDLFIVKLNLVTIDNEAFEINGKQFKVHL